MERKGPQAGSGVASLLASFQKPATAVLEQLPERPPAEAKELRPECLHAPIGGLELVPRLGGRDSLALGALQQLHVEERLGCDRRQLDLVDRVPIHHLVHRVRSQPGASFFNHEGTRARRMASLCVSSRVP
jgi:hypothetical protein